MYPCTQPNKFLFQLFSASGSGITDSKTSHYTQFSGVLIRASQDTFKAASKSLAEDENVSISEGFRGFTPSRGSTPSRGFTPSRSRVVSPEPVVTEVPKQRAANPEPAVSQIVVKSEEIKEDDKLQQSYSAVAKKSAPKAAPGTSKTTPNTPKTAPSSQPGTAPPSAPATPKTASTGAFYSFLKR